MKITNNRMKNTMLSKYFKIYLFILLMGLSLNGYGQSGNTKSVKVIARSMPDSIMIRWAPASYDKWQLGNTYGYIIERYTIIKKGEMVPEPKGVVLTPKPLKPIALKLWEPLLKYDDYIGVAAQAIYGESFEVSAKSGNGGVMDIVNKATDQENRFSFALFAADQSPLVARASGLWYTDKNVKKDEGYLYRVYLTKQNAAIVDTGYIYASTDEYKPLPEPLNLKGSFGDKIVMITWDKMGAEMYYSSFVIEKSIDEGETFHRITDKPIINTSVSGENTYPFYFYIDSVANNKSYLYRVCGLSPFGEKGPYSDTISGMGFAAIKDIPHITHKEILPGDNIQLQWDFPKDKENTIEGFRVLRSDNAETGFIKVSDNIEVGYRTFVDKKPLPTNYYKVMAFKENQTPSISLPVLIQLQDSTPPSPPVGLKSTIDTSGIVKLSWDANTEPDIYGYRVYRANANHEEFSQLTIAPILTNSFVDTVSLKTLSKQVFYKILALDQRQNYSAFSEIHAVERPDIIPPVPPLIIDFKSTKKGIFLVWENSSSGDVLSQALYRKSATDSSWVAIKNFEIDSVKSFNDSTLVTGMLYSYMLKAKDKAGNESSPSNIIKCKSLFTNANKTPDLKYDINRQENSITLRWEKITDAREYQLYKAMGSDNVTLYKTLNGQTTNFIDKQLTPGNEYSYMVKAVTSGSIIFYKKIKVLF